MTVKHFAVMAGLWLSVATGAQAQAGSHAGHGHDTQSDTAPASAPVNAEAWAEGEIRKIDLKTGKGPLVVSCGNQRRQSVVVVAPCGHVGKSQSGLSTCPCGLVVHELEAVS